MTMRSVRSTRTVGMNRSADAFILGACGAVLTRSIPIEATTAPGSVGELRVRVPDQVHEPVPGLVEFPGQLAGELDGQGGGRMRGYLDCQSAAVDFVVTPSGSRGRLTNPPGLGRRQSD